jgi:hypothetical protein
MTPSADMPPSLPEPEPDPAPPPAKKKQAKKTLLLWVLLIFMFLGIWQFLSPSSGGGAAPEPKLPPCEASGWSSSYPLLGAVLICCGFFFWIYRLYGVGRDFALATEPATLAGAERRFGDAVSIFDDLLERYKKKPGYVASLSLSKGYAELLAGRLDQALATFIRTEKMKNILFSSGVRTLAATYLAFVYALRGDVSSSETWVGESRRRLAKNKDNRLLYAARLCEAEAALAIRKGDPEAAIRLLEASWSKLRESLTGNALRVIEVLRSLAESSRGPRGYNVVGERLVRVEPVIPGEFDFLGAAWPEMQTFLVSHKLSRPSA